MREIQMECCFKTYGKCPYEQDGKGCTQGYKDTSLGQSLCDIKEPKDIEWKDEWNPEILFADGSFEEGLKEVLTTMSESKK